MGDFGFDVPGLLAPSVCRFVVVAMGDGRVRVSTFFEVLDIEFVVVCLGSIEYRSMAVVHGS